VHISTRLQTVVEDTVHAVTATWLNTSQGDQGNIKMNRFVLFTSPEYAVIL